MQITPMQYKSESGMSLDKRNQDFGVANDIFMDNAPEQIAYREGNNGCPHDRSKFFME